MSRWQGRMETKQGFLGRIVDIGAELFAMSAACVRAEHLRAEGDHGREAYQLADAFCRQARIPRRGTLRPPVDQHRRPRPQGRQGRAGRRLRVAGAGRRRPPRGTVRGSRTRRRASHGGRTSIAPIR
ncbi:hypothetical protein LV779_17730 [Streptomyces thinghirensis]|nr:hypothetical protein [Streptomyces thinghirensis]